MCTHEIKDSYLIYILNVLVMPKNYVNLLTISDLHKQFLHPIMESTNSTEEQYDMNIKDDHKETNFKECVLKKSIRNQFSMINTNPVQERGSRLYVDKIWMKK